MNENTDEAAASIKKSPKEQILGVAAGLRRHVIFLFFVLLMAVYGFVIYKINVYSNVEPTSSEISAKVKAVTTPNISQSLVNQLQKLQDNSVNVKALFNEARQNPFQE